MSTADKKREPYAALKKWEPYLSPKIEMIVAVTFEGGATIQTNEAEIRGYLKCLDDRRAGEAALRRLGLGAKAVFGGPWGALHFERLMELIENSNRAARNASKSRKPATKKLTPAKVLKFKAEWEAKWRKTRGWITAAASEFKVSPKTIRTLIDGA